jgi:hypothetical protein
MKKEELKAIKRRCEAATWGAWEVTPCGDEPHVLYDIYNSSMPITSDCIQCDAEFIAHARTDVPQLVAEVERLRALISELEPYATERVFEIGGDDMAGRLSKRIREALGGE